MQGLHPCLVHTCISSNFEFCTKGGIYVSETFLVSFKVCSNEGPCPFLRRDNYEIGFLGEEDLSLFILKGHAFFQREIIKKNCKNTFTKFENLLLLNYLANFMIYLYIYVFFAYRGDC